MLETLFQNVEVRQPLLAGPMGPYLDVLASRLLELGYCQSQARKIVRTASALGHWLAERGLTPVEARKAELRAFIVAQKRMPCGRRLSATELEIVLKDCQSEEHGCLRDRAFIALLARLGVRSGELRSLRLEYIDWSEGLLHIKESKSGHGRTLPLPGDAGNLLATASDILWRR